MLVRSEKLFSLAAWVARLPRTSARASCPDCRVSNSCRDRLQAERTTLFPLRDGRAQLSIDPSPHARHDLGQRFHIRSRGVEVHDAGAQQVAAAADGVGDEHFTPRCSRSSSSRLSASRWRSRCPSATFARIGNANGLILLANFLQRSTTAFSCARFPRLFAFKEGMYDTQISALLGSPTVSGLLAPPARRQRLAHSACGAPSTPRPSGPAARRGATLAGAGHASQERVGERLRGALGEDLGKGGGRTA
jgi:hypothetical protein